MKKYPKCFPRNFKTEILPKGAKEEDKDGLNMNNLYFENVVHVGNLYLEHIFYAFESEPILFVCSDDARKLYLCLCAEIRYGQRWIAVESNLNLLKKLTNEKIDIASAFFRAERGYCY